LFLLFPARGWAVGQNDQPVNAEGKSPQATARTGAVRGPQMGKDWKEKREGTHGGYPKEVLKW
jgi:hypothetical protein